MTVLMAGHPAVHSQSGPRIDQQSSLIPNRRDAAVCSHGTAHRVPIIPANQAAESSVLSFGKLAVPQTRHLPYCPGMPDLGEAESELSR